MKDNVMMIRTANGRIYRLVGKWDNEIVFAPADGKDDQVLIYTPKEFKQHLDNNMITVVDNISSK
jgi:hypothetical protein